MNMFKPEFDYTDSIYYASVIINRPHEPKAINETFSAILIAYDYAENAMPISEFLVRQLHQGIAHWLVDAGTYRTCNVAIGGETLSWRGLDWAMANLHPFNVTDEASLREWYIRFETIHPFEDGNGRVGGAIIAGYSLQRFGRILVPLQ